MMDEINRFLGNVISAHYIGSEFIREIENNPRLTTHQREWLKYEIVTEIVEFKRAIEKENTKLLFSGSEASMAARPIIVLITIVALMSFFLDRT